MISYKNLYLSQEYYLNKGFQILETPWFVDKHISDLTRPKDAGEFQILQNKKVLVASGEQSFLALKENLKPGLYQTITPCFRDEVETEIKKIQFMKNELIIAHPKKIKNKPDLKFLVDTAMSFFMTLVDDKTELKVIQTDQGLDILYRGIEIGSYGEREISSFSWIYGTGLAEPRFSLIKK